MPFQFRMYFATLIQAFKLKAPWTPARIGLMFFVMFIFPPLQLLNWATLMIDEIFFRGYRKVEIKNPLFIIGNARSGTTYMHRLMSLNQDYFKTLKMYDLIFLSVFAKKLILGIAKLDAMVGAPLARGLDKLQAIVMKEADKIHKLRLNHPEEDEAVMIHLFSTIYIGLLFPVDAQKPNMRFDEMPKAKRDELMGFYKRCIQRFMYVHGGNAFHLLSKNPLFCNKVASVLETFTDARVVYMVRTPYESVASTYNMVDRIWNVQLKLPNPEEQRGPILDNCVYSYDHALQVLDRHDQSASIIVRYEDLVREPRATIEAIHKKFNIPVSERFHAELVRVTDKNKNYKSEHHYSLEQFGLEKEQVYLATQNVFARFGFDKEGEFADDAAMAQRSVKIA